MTLELERLFRYQASPKRFLIKKILSSIYHEKVNLVLLYKCLQQTVMLLQSQHKIVLGKSQIYHYNTHYLLLNCNIVITLRNEVLCVIFN